MKNDGPPDDWGETTPKSANADSAGESVARQANALRTAWILAVRNHVQKQTGQPCTYNSKVKWDGGLCRETRRTYKPVWPKIVMKARSEGLDPIHLVAALFAAWGTGPSPNSPELIVSPENIGRYHTQTRTTEQRVGIVLKTDEAIYRSAVWSAAQSIPDPDAAVRFVLNDLSRKMSPLFRYSVAAMKNMPDVADKWRDMAHNQLAAAPDIYLSAWGTIIPQDITAAALAATGKVA